MPKMSRKPQTQALYTIGHSTRTLEEFIALLKAYGIQQIIDVRTIPRSRHNPQFNSEYLAAALPRAGVTYVHEPLLGGLRHARKDSLNTGWENLSFRGFADYMQTEDFSRGLDRLTLLAKKRTIAIMCAEAVPWRCHRSLIADAAKKRGTSVIHIISKASAQPHRYTSFLRVHGGKLLYPAPQLNLFNPTPDAKAKKSRAKTAHHH